MKISLKILSFSLMLISFQQAWAALPFYQAEKALQRGELLEAKQKMKLSEERHFLLQSAKWLKVDLMISNISLLEESDLEELRSETIELQRLYPENAKSYLYEAIVQSVQLDRRLKSVEWDDILQQLEKSYDKRGANLWVVHRAAMMIIENKEKMKVETWNLWLQRLSEVVSILPENYLSPSLVFMTKVGLSFEETQRIVPSDADSYEVWLKIVEAQKNWLLWRDVNDAYMQLSIQEYQQHLNRAALALSDKDYKAAKNSFKKMTWRPRGLKEGELGLLYLGLLESSLQVKEEKNFEELLLDYFRKADPQDPFLQSFDLEKISKVLDKALAKAYLAYWKKDFEKAAHFFESLKLENSTDRYYFSQALEKINERERAVNILNRDLLNQYDKIDLRNLVYLKQLNPVSLLEIEKVLDRNKPFYKPVSAWTSNSAVNNRIHKDQKTGMVISLPPGKSKIYFTARKKEASKGVGALVFRLSESYLGSFTVTSTKWKTSILEVESLGGRYWLEVEAINSETSIEFGSLRIKSEAISKVEVMK